jgi:hypothetical protein
MADSGATAKAPLVRRAEQLLSKAVGLLTASFQLFGGQGLATENAGRRVGLGCYLVHGFLL